MHNIHVYTTMYVVDTLPETPLDIQRIFMYNVKQ